MTPINALHRRLLRDHPQTASDLRLLRELTYELAYDALLYEEAAQATLSHFPDELRSAARWHQQSINIRLQAREILRSFSSAGLRHSSTGA